MLGPDSRDQRHKVQNKEGLKCCPKTMDLDALSKHWAKGISHTATRQWWPETDLEILNLYSFDMSLITFLHVSTTFFALCSYNMSICLLCYISNIYILITLHIASDNSFVVHTQKNAYHKYIYHKLLNALWSSLSRSAMPSAICLHTLQALRCRLRSPRTWQAPYYTDTDLYRHILTPRFRILGAQGTRHITAKSNTSNSCRIVSAVFKVLKKMCQFNMFLDCTHCTLRTALSCCWRIVRPRCQRWIKNHLAAQKSSLPRCQSTEVADCLFHLKRHPKEIQIHSTRHIASIKSLARSHRSHFTDPCPIACLCRPHDFR